PGGCGKRPGRGSRAVSSACCLLSPAADAELERSRAVAVAGAGRSGRRTGMPGDKAGEERVMMTEIRTAACVVTGGAGAIGSRLVRRLLDDGAERVDVLDDLSSGHDWLLPSDARVRLEQA